MSAPSPGRRVAFRGLNRISPLVLAAVSLLSCERQQQSANQTSLNTLTTKPQHAQGLIHALKDPHQGCRQRAENAIVNPEPFFRPLWNGRDENEHARKFWGAQDRELLKNALLEQPNFQDRDPRWEITNLLGEPDEHSKFLIQSFSDKSISVEDLSHLFERDDNFELNISYEDEELETLIKSVIAIIDSESSADSDADRADPKLASKPSKYDWSAVINMAKYSNDQGLLWGVVKRALERGDGNHQRVAIRAILEKKIPLDLCQETLLKFQSGGKNGDGLRLQALQALLVLGYAPALEIVRDIRLDHEIPLGVYPEFGGLKRDILLSLFSADPDKAVVEKIIAVLGKYHAEVREMGLPGLGGFGTIISFVRDCDRKAKLANLILEVARTPEPKNWDHILTAAEMFDLQELAPLLTEVFDSLPEDAALKGGSNATRTRLLLTLRSLMPDAPLTKQILSALASDQSETRYAALKVIRAQDSSPELLRTLREIALRGLTNESLQHESDLGVIAMGEIGDPSNLATILKLLEIKIYISEDEKSLRDIVEAAMKCSDGDSPLLAEFLRGRAASDDHPYWPFEFLPEVDPSFGHSLDSSLFALSQCHRAYGYVADLRTWAHVLAGGDGDVVRVCKYLGMAPRPTIPTNIVESRKDLSALIRAWHWAAANDLRKPAEELRKDALHWIGTILGAEMDDWSSDDWDDQLAPFLRSLRKDEDSSDEKTFCIMNLEQARKRFMVVPKPWVRSIIALVTIAIFAGLLFAVFRESSGGFVRWIPFFAWLATGAASGVATKFYQSLHLDLPVLLVGLGAEFAGLLALGAISPKFLRGVAKVEPFNVIFRAAATATSSGRKRLLSGYAASLRSQLEQDKEQANGEAYVPMPAVVRGDNHLENVTQAPVDWITKRLIESSIAAAPRVILSGPAGVGKSALLRAVIDRLLTDWEASVKGAALPVLLSGAESEIRDGITAALGTNLVGSEWLDMHLSSGDLIVVIDGISESSIGLGALQLFLRNSGSESTPILMSARPEGLWERTVKGRANWLTAKPVLMNNANLERFIRNYAKDDDSLRAHFPPGQTAIRAVHQSVWDACKENGTGEASYRPILVRLALNKDLLESAALGSRVTKAELYRLYADHLLRNVGNSGERARFLEWTRRWSLRTYWSDGRRHRDLDLIAPEERERLEGLIGLGLLVDRRVGRIGQNRVGFFHDSMQSYFVAWALAEEDEKNPEFGWLRQPEAEELSPYECDSDTVVPQSERLDRELVINIAATHRFFAASTESGKRRSELFEMCLATFDPQHLREFLTSAVRGWTKEHWQKLSTLSVMGAIPQSLWKECEGIESSRELLRQLLLKIEGLEDPQAVEILGSLYLDLAPSEQRRTRST